MASAELWKQADEEKEELFSAMEQVQNKLAKKTSGYREDIDLRSCKWDQVMREVQLAATRWRTSTKESRTMVYIEKVGQNSDAFANWLELLPTGDYGSRYAPALASS